MSQMGHKPMVWRPALLPSQGQCSRKPQVTDTYTAQKSVYSSLPSSQWFMGQHGGRKVRPDCDQVCSTYKVLGDPSSNQDTQGLHSLCMLYCKLTCTVFSHNGLLPAVHSDPPEICPPRPSIV